MPVSATQVLSTLGVVIEVGHTVVHILGPVPDFDRNYLNTTKSADMTMSNRTCMNVV